MLMCFALLLQVPWVKEKHGDFMKMKDDVEEVMNTFLLDDHKLALQKCWPPYISMCYDAMWTYTCMCCAADMRRGRTQLRRR